VGRGIWEIEREGGWVEMEVEAVEGGVEGGIGVGDV
jgi:hypothetical protein